MRKGVVRLSMREFVLILGAVVVLLLILLLLYNFYADVTDTGIRIEFR